MGRSTLRILIATVAIVLVACSPAAAPTTSPGGGSQAPVSPGAQPSSSAAVQPSAAPGSPAGGGTTNWCFNTVEEVSAALKVTATQAISTDAPGIGGGCFYNDANGTPVFATSTVTAEGAVGTFEAATGGADAVTIDGIGDRAVLITPQGPLAVLKGTAFTSMGALPPNPLLSDAGAYRSAHETLARSAAGRMP